MVAGEPRRNGESGPHAGAAVDAEHLAVDPLTVVGHEERHHPRDVVRTAEARGTTDPQRVVTELARQTGAHRRRDDEAGCDGVRADPLAAQRDATWRTNELMPAFDAAYDGRSGSPM